jgi:hypothetical protein
MRHFFFNSLLFVFPFLTFLCLLDACVYVCCFGFLVTFAKVRECFQWVIIRYLHGEGIVHRDLKVCCLFHLLFHLTS